MDQNNPIPQKQRTTSQQIFKFKEIKMRLALIASLALVATACSRQEAFQCPSSTEEIQTLIGQRFHWWKSDADKSRRDEARSPYGNIEFLKPPVSPDPSSDATLLGIITATFKADGVSEKYVYFYNCRKSIMEFSGPVPNEKNQK